MPTDDRIVPIPLSQGLDQKHDPYQLVAGKVASVVNAEFDKIGALQKRLGYSELTFTPATNPFVKLTTFQNELNTINSFGQSIQSWSPAVNGMSPALALAPPTVTRIPVATSTSLIYSPQVAYCNGFLVYTWIGGDVQSLLGLFFFGDIFIAVYDAETGACVVEPKNISAPVGGPLNTSPQMVAVGNHVFLTYADFPDSTHGHLYVASINCSSGIPFVSAGPIIHSGESSIFNYAWIKDMATDGTNAFVVWNDSSTTPPQVHMESFDPILATTVLAYTPVGVSGSGLLSVGIDIDAANGLAWVAMAGQDANGLNDKVYAWQKHIGMPANSVNPGLIYTTSQSLGNGFSTEMGIKALDVNHATLVYSTNLGGDVYDTFLAQPIVPSGGTMIPGGSSHLQISVFPSSKPFTVNGKTYIMGTVFSAGSSLNGTQCLFDLHSEDLGHPNLMWTPVAVTAPRQGTFFDRTDSDLANVIFNPQTNTWDTLGTIQLANLDTGRAGILKLSFDFDARNHFDTAEMGNNLHLASGLPMYYDGTSVGEIGFLNIPDPVVLSSSFGSSGSMAAGTYQYQVVWEWIDSRGQLHQSAPSVQQAITVTGAFTNVVTVKWEPLHATMRQLVASSSVDQSQIQAAIYRSTAGGTILYRLTPDISPSTLFNQPGDYQASYVDTAPDFNLSTHAVIYTAGGVLANFNPPSAKYTCIHDQRLWLAGLDNQKEVWYSQPHVDGQAIAFDDALAFFVDEGNEITGIVGMDDKLIVFKSDRIFYVSGEGPNALGQNNGYSTPQRVPSDVGCIDHRSIVLTPQGILFQSSVGISLLDRAMQVTSNYSAPVTDHLVAYPNVTSAVIHPSKSQIRFTCVNEASGLNAAGIILVHDYLTNAWTVQQITEPFFSAAFYPTGMWSGAVWDGGYVLASTMGTLMEENAPTNPTAYLDGPNWVTMSVETPWLDFSGMASYQRVKRIQVVGEQLDNCDVSMMVTTDYHSASFSVSNPDPRLQTVTFPSASLAGGPSSLFQQELHVRDQKSEAFKVFLTDSATTFSPSTPGALPYGGQGLRLSQLVFKVGTKKGLQKLPPGSRH